ncbi:uncharacterized protein AB675_2278 [Cyphellophora attinorum]|uniref:Uncharacterized protein n=1 Tax=Cyphellophora attinorum TaxID=1664694 RepID=A0A0N1HKM7_9EURO|nr:uncharacterized protein AB675_2278 [Phialophora attinorum]KPI34860.1 hypothetical protein AB675_2278 [Phialophora attinorum]
MAEKNHDLLVETTPQPAASSVHEEEPSTSAAPRRSSLAKLTDRFKHHSASSASSKKELELTRRRLEAVMFYEQNLTERINDTLADDKDRAKARSEKKVFDSMSQDDKEMWVANRITVKEGWGAGMYGEGACPPGMWYK